MNNITKSPSLTVLQTEQIWKEAGFLPPSGYQKFIEYLHCLNMGDDLPKESDWPVCCSNKDEQERFIITNKNRLISFAESCGIPWKGRNSISIAENICSRLVAEYFGHG